MENICSYLLLLLLLLLPLYLFIILRKCSCQQRPSPPPSPLALPLIGHLHLIKGALHLSLTSLSSRYGPIFSLQLGCKSFVVISSPSAVEECFTKNDVVLANRPRTMAAGWLSYNYAAFVWSPYGNYWKTIRKLSVTELFSDRSLQNSAQIREEETRKILRVLIRVSKSGHEVDLNYLASIYSFNQTMRAVSGKSWVEEGEIGGESGKEKLKQIRGIFSTTLSQGMCDFFPILRRIGYKGLEKNLIALYKKRDEFLQDLICAVKGRSEDGDDKQMSSLIEKLLRLQASEPEFYTDDVIKSIIQMMFIAGTETTAETIEWAMSLLLTHPIALLKLRQEIDDNIRHDHLLTEMDLAKLPYLRCVINETLRLYPPAPILVPHHSSENFIVGGYTVPKGTTLLVNACAIHRDPKLWNRPNEFSPNRFMNEEMEGELGYKFVPFGKGRRACPGSGLGLRMVSLALGLFVQCFEWEKMEEHEDIESMYKSLAKAKPLKVVCVPRREVVDVLSQIYCKM